VPTPPVRDGGLEGQLVLMGFVRHTSPTNCAWEFGMPMGKRVRNVMRMGARMIFFKVLVSYFSCFNVLSSYNWFSLGRTALSYRGCLWVGVEFGLMGRSGVDD
jgi:hypothetical protein